MFKLLLSSSLRLIFKTKTISTAKVISLSVGASVFLLAILYSISEISFDKQHPDAERIVRYVHQVASPEGLQSFAITSATTGPALKQRFAQVEDFNRILILPLTLATEKADIIFNETRYAFADSTFFRFFNIPLHHSVSNPLRAANSVILTPAMSKKYFGSADPVGRILLIDGRIAVTVAGVFKSDLDRTHLKFDFLCSFATLDQMKSDKKLSAQYPALGNLESKGFYAFYTYLKLSKPSDMAELIDKFPAFIEEFRGEGRSRRLKPTLQQLTDIHLRSGLVYEMGPNGTDAQVWTYLSIGAIILLVGIINYINLTMAEFSGRMDSVRLKRVLGIDSLSLILQHIFESAIIAFFSILLAILIFFGLLPIFNFLNADPISFGIMELAIVVFALYLTVIILSGVYPALWIARYHKQATVVNDRSLPARMPARSVLAFVQLSSSIALMILTFIIFYQLDFLSQKSLMFESDQVFSVNATALDPALVSGFKQSLESEHSISGVGACSALPGEQFSNLGLILPEHAGEEERRIGAFQSYVDDGYLATLGVRMLEGRFFNKLSGPVDSLSSIVVNERCAKLIGDGIIGKEINVPQLTTGLYAKKTVIGVVKDFHFASFHEDIQPMVLEYNPSLSRNVIVKSQRFSTSLQVAEDKWRSHSNGLPFEYEFIEERFEDHYVRDKGQKKIVTGISAMSILIACIGIFGNTIFMVRAREREVAIRKVNGASKRSIFILMFRPAFVLLIISLLVAVPISTYFGVLWLQSYPFRIDISFWYFVGAFLVIALAVTATMSFQLAKLAKQNPAVVLKQK